MERIALKHIELPAEMLPKWSRLWTVEELWLERHKGKMDSEWEEARFQREA